MSEIKIPESLPRLTPEAKRKLISIADTYAKSRKENVLYYLIKGEVTLEELPLLDNVPEVKEWLRVNLEERRFPPDENERQDREIILRTLPGGDAALEALDETARASLVSMLEDYLSHYQEKKPKDNILDLVEKKLQLLKELAAKGREQAEWEAVDTHDYRSLLRYYINHPLTPYFSELDNGMWDLVDRNDPASLRRFMEDMPRSAHLDEARRLMETYDKWCALQYTGSLEEVYELWTQLTNEVFKGAVEQRLEELKRRRLEELKERISSLNYYDYQNLVNGGIFIKEDFIRAGIVTEKLLLTLEKYKEPSSRSIDLTSPNSNSLGKCTDVYLIGIPSTGKTCVLMGLLKSSLGLWDWAGQDYGNALLNFCDAGIVPNRTPGNYCNFINGKIKDPKNPSVYHPINLIEIAGEGFAERVANNAESFSFSDMGEGIPEILASNNEKVFFFIIDPTCDEVKIRTEDELTGNQVIKIIPQKQTIRKFISLLFPFGGQSRNEEILRLTKAIHIVVTKADSLSGNRKERDEKAKDLLLRQYPQELKSLQEICSSGRYDINPGTHNAIHLFTYSLGHFYLGGAFDYESDDSDKLLRAISFLSSGRREIPTLWERAKMWLNQ